MVCVVMVRGVCREFRKLQGNTTHVTTSISSRLYKEEIGEKKSSPLCRGRGREEAVPAAVVAGVVSNEERREWVRKIGEVNTRER